MMELMFRWKNGAGPDEAAVGFWFRDKVAKIKARRRQDEVELREKRRERIAEILPAILKRLEKKG